MFFTRATCGTPSLGLPFRQSIFLSIYRVWENCPEVLAYSFDENEAEKAFNQNSKRLSNQALLKLRRVSNSFFKFSKRCLPMNFSLRRSKYTQINDGHGHFLSQLASYSCQFNTGNYQGFPKNISAVDI